MTPRPERRRPLADRFWSKVAPPDEQGCRLWTGSGGVYGALFLEALPRVDGKKSARRGLAHRVAYELAIGPVPPGLVVMHSCDRPRCCEPSHLRVGTYAENTADMSAKGRRRDVFGSRQWMAKLTEADIPVIRAAVARGETHKSIADRYAVTRTVVTRIITGRTWVRA